MLKEERTPLLRYGVSLTSVAVATLIRFLLSSVLGDGVPFIFYLPAVVASAWYGGLWPGLLSTGLSALIAWFLFIPFPYSFGFGALSAPVRLLAFLLAGFLISGLAEVTRRAYKRAVISSRGEREERERLRVTLASIGDAVIATDVRGRVTLLNGVAEALTGWKQAEALGKELNEVFCIVNEKTREKVESPLARVLGEGAIVGLANHSVLIAKDGAERTIADSGAPIRDDSGKIIGAVLVFRDITERKRLEHSLRTSEERLRLSHQVSGVGAWEWNGVTNEVFWSPEYREIYGLGAEEEPSFEKGMAVVVEEDREGIHRAISQALDSGEEFTSEHRIRHPQKGLRWIQATGRTVNDERQTVARMIGLVRDVTERKQAEQELREGAERLRLALEAAGLGDWSWEATSSVVTLSARAAKILGVQGTQMPWAEMRALLHHEDHGPAGQAVRQAFSTDSHFDIEYRVLRPGEEPTWVAAKGQAIYDETGVLKGIRGVVQDITERKQAEEMRLRLIEQLREEDKRKDEFLAMLAHELRNPLAPVRNAVGLLKHYSANDPRLQWPREVIDRQVTHMTRLVDDLLDVSRITRGKIELRREIVEMRAVVERALETSRPLVDAKGQRLTVELPAEPLLVKADVTRMAQVLSNLVSNAAKYTDAGGSVQLLVEKNGGEVVARVRDNGVGIPADILSHIFELFAQAERSLDRSQGGLGIGLTVVKALAEMHGGRVEAYSEGPNKGSEFTVYLPAFAGTLPEEVSATAVAAARQTALGRRILVVDDNVDSAESMAMLLQFEGHAVKTAFDGLEALQATREFRPNVVLLDIGLPGMDGYEVARELRRDGEQQRVVLIALTGYGQAEDRQRSQDAGFDHHFTKPVDHDSLNSLIKSLEVE